MIAAVMLISSCAGVTLLPESSAVYDAHLAFETTAGTLMLYGNANAVSRTGDIILSGDEDTFQLSVQPIHAASQPTVTIDGEVLALGELSKEYTLEVGERRSIQVISVPKTGGEDYIKYYNLKACRTDIAVEAECTVSDLGDSGRQLKVDFYFPQGAKFDALAMSLHFDPERLQYADKTTNAATAKFNPGSSFEPNFKYLRGNGFFHQLLASVKNSTGTLQMQFAKHESVTRLKVYTAGADPVFTLYFKVLDDAVLDGTALYFDSNDANVINGMSLGCYFTDSTGAESYTSLSYPDMATITGLARSFIPPAAQPVGGTVQVLPVRDSYSYGETVTILARPTEGYVFSSWKLPATYALPEELTSEQMSSPELTFELLEDIDLSGLEAVFEKSDAVLENDISLDFTGESYTGDRFLIFNPPYGETLTVDADIAELESESGVLIEEELGERIVISAPGETDPNGLFRADMTEELLPEYESIGLFMEEMNSAAVQPPTLGETRTFKVRNALYGQGTTNGWNDGSFELKEICDVDGFSLYVWVCQDKEYQPMALTDDQIAELAESFQASYSVLAEQYHEVTDTNGNGGLDILIYDIYDSYTNGGSVYMGGFVNPNEFYGILGQGEYANCGNYGDFLHLDTYPSMGTVLSQPQLDQAKSTMVHETQHLCVQSNYTSASDYGSYGPPTWINEGLSLTAEHQMFGVLESRIRNYNSATAILNGLPFTDEWTGSDAVYKYALAYLFFQYVSEQTGDDSFTQAFYTNYDSSDLPGSISEILQGFEVFETLDLDEVMTRYYLALLLKMPSGPYGFCGNENFDDVEARLLKRLPAKLSSGAAVYLQKETTSVLTPNVSNDLRYAGIVDPVYTLSLLSGEGGSASVTDSRYTYDRDAVAEATASPMHGYLFSHWLVNGKRVVDNPIEITMTEDVELQPVFSKIPTYTISLVYDAAVGEVTVTDADDVPVPDLSSVIEDTELVFSANATDPEWLFVGWKVNGEETDDEVLILTVTENTTVEAVFQGRPRYAVTVNCDAGMGSVTVVNSVTGAAVEDLSSVPENTPLTFTATPNKGYIFEGWSGTFTDTEKTTEYTVTNANVTVTAEFRAAEKIEGKVLVNAGIGVPNVENRTITFTPEAGTLEGVDKIVLALVDDDAVMAEDGSLYEGDTVTLTAYPSEGYTFLYWQMAPIPQEALNSLLQEGFNLMTLSESQAGTATDNPLTFELKADGNWYTPVLRDAQAFTRRDLQLMQLVTTNLPGRALVHDGVLDETLLGYPEDEIETQTEDETDSEDTPKIPLSNIHFTQGQINYQLNLIEADSESVDFVPIMRSGYGERITTAFELHRDGAVIQSVLDINQHNTDENGNYVSYIYHPVDNPILIDKLPPITMEDVQDGDIIYIICYETKYGADSPEALTYEIQVTRKEPKVSVEFLTAEEAGVSYMDMEIKMSNILLGSFQLPMLLLDGMVPMDQDGNEITCPTGQQVMLDDHGVKLVHEELTIEGSYFLNDDTDILRVVLTPKDSDGDGNYLEEVLVTEDTHIVTIRFKLEQEVKQDDLRRANEETMALVYDMECLELELFIFQTSGMRVTFEAFDAGNWLADTESWKDYFQIIMEAEDGSETIVEYDEITVTWTDPETVSGGIKPQAMVAEIRYVTPSVYTFIMDLPGHTKYTVSGLEVTGEVPFEEFDLTVADETSGKKLYPAYCGDLDNDQYISLIDRYELTRAMNQKTPQDAYKYYDLNGDGVINLLDLSIQTNLANYLRGEAVYTFSKTD